MASSSACTLLPRRTTKHLVLATALFVTLLHHGCVAVNPVTAPITQGINVHVTTFTKLPDFRGRGAKIISITPLSAFLYVSTQWHIYKVYPKGYVQLFLDMHEIMTSATGRGLNMRNTVHGGLRGLAFHPGFSKNGLLYTSVMEDRPSNPGDFEYLSTTSSPIDADSVVIEWKYNFITKSVIPSSYRQVVRIAMPVYDHPIKEIKFHNGLLYISHGDGSVLSATAGGGQSKDALGKILRINPLKKGTGAYSIPPDNPFLNDTSMLNEVYALGFRNPHNFCFSKSGNLIAVDAGRDNVEEVNLVKKGGNYGWSDREGTFVHKEGGGIMTGVGPLPEDDAKYGYEYPIAQYGHEGISGAGMSGFAIAGGCPIENGSPMAGLYLYVDFPRSGTLYYSKLADMYAAVTKGSPSKLTQAPTYRASVLYNHDNDISTPSKWFKSLGDMLRSEPEMAGSERVDIRLGQGTGGELYFTSKQNGKIYKITSSMVGGPGVKKCT